MRETGSFKTSGLIYERQGTNCGRNFFKIQGFKEIAT